MILTINTGSENNSIALYKPSKIEDEIVWQSYKTQSQELLPKIDKLLKSNKVKLSDLKAIAVYQGPGSYTGLRVGFSVANALAWSLDIPVIGIKNPKSKLQIPNKFQNPNYNVKNQLTNPPATFTCSGGGHGQQISKLASQQINCISALEIAQKAEDSLHLLKLKKFSKISIPFYGKKI